MSTAIAVSSEVNRGSVSLGRTIGTRAASRPAPGSSVGGPANPSPAPTDAIAPLALGSKEALIGERDELIPSGGRLELRETADADADRHRDFGRLGSNRKGGDGCPYSFRQAHG